MLWRQAVIWQQGTTSIATASVPRATAEAELRSSQRPTCYIDDSGAFIHPASGIADPALSDRDLMIYGMKTGQGARIGTTADQARIFHEDMVEFWQGALS